MSLPAGPMTSLAASLEGVYTLRSLDGSERQVPAIEFVIGNHQNVLLPGELLRTIDLPAVGAAQAGGISPGVADAHGSLHRARIGTAASPDATFVLTVTASTPYPVQLTFAEVPDARTLRERLHEEIPDEWVLRRRSWIAGLPQAHDALLRRADSGRAGQRASLEERVMTYHVNGKTSPRSRRPASACAPSCAS